MTCKGNGPLCSDSGKRFMVSVSLCLVYLGMWGNNVQWEYSGTSLIQMQPPDKAANEVLVKISHQSMAVVWVCRVIMFSGSTLEPH